MVKRPLYVCRECNYVFPEELAELIDKRVQVFCEMCGTEIHKGEHIWWYKPRPDYNKFTKIKDYYKWRKRCYDCEPRSMEELNQLKARDRIDDTNYRN